MRRAINRSLRPALEGLEGRQLLSTTSHGHVAPHLAAEAIRAVPLTGVESGSYSIRMERSSPPLEHFHFQGTGTVAGLGAVQVTGDVALREDLSQAGTASGVLTLTLPGGRGTARALVSETIPAHTGSIGSLPFNYNVQGGTGLFRGGFDSGTGTLTRTSTTTVPGGAKGGFIVQVVSGHDTGLVAGRQPLSPAAAPTGTPALAAAPTGTPALAAAPLPDATEVDPTAVVNPASPNDIPAPQGAGQSAPVGTLTVTNLNDSGVGSLRSELAQAHDGDTISFDPSLKGTITLTSGELKVGGDVKIEGPGSANLSISGNHASRVFEILSGADAAISGLTVTDGVANAPGSGVNLVGGGGIFVAHDAKVTLTGSVVRGNIGNSTSATAVAPGLVAGTGGGIFNAGTLTLIDDLISGNTANTGSALDVIGGQVNASGGGIFNRRDATLTLVRTTVINNTANGGASSFLSDAEGGGIVSSGILSLTDAVVSGNIANAGPVTADRSATSSGAGGGLMIMGGTVTVANSFFLDNTANTASASATNLQSGLVDVRGEGGGIFNQGALTVTTTAFSGNVANSGSATGGFVATVTGYGGAIDNHGSPLTATGLGVTDNIANAGSARTAARGLGGGISGSGQITVESSLVDGNIANAGSAFAIDAQGGGIYDQSALELTGTDVTNNTVNSGTAHVLSASGGGLWVAGGTITSSNVSFDIVNSGSGIPLMYLYAGGIYDRGRLTVTDSFVTYNNINTDPTSGQGLGSFATGGGMFVDGPTAFVTLNDTSMAANYALDPVAGRTNLNVRAGGRVDPNSANNYIGGGSNSGLVNGVNGNVLQ
jgi:hypothetical protein